MPCTRPVVRSLPLRYSRRFAYFLLKCVLRLVRTTYGAGSIRGLCADAAGDCRIPWDKPLCPPTPPAPLEPSLSRDWVSNGTCGGYHLLDPANPSKVLGLVYTVRTVDGPQWCWSAWAPGSVNATHGRDCTDRASAMRKVESIAQPRLIREIESLRTLLSAH